MNIYDYPSNSLSNYYEMRAKVNMLIGVLV